MYKITKIEATNFMCYAKLNLDLTTAQNIIIKSDQQENSNGWGKSTIIEAICWVLYEKLLRGGGGKVELQDVISIGEQEVWGAIELNDDEKKSLVRIERFRSAKEKYLKMYINGVERVFDKKTDLNVFIADWLGLDYDGFTRRVLSPENISFLNLTSAERFYAIANLINFNWDKVWNNIQNKIKACKSEMDMLDANMSELQLTIIREEGEAKLFQSQTNMLQEQKKVLEDKRDKARNEYTLIQKKLEKCEKEIENYDGIFSSFTATERLINDELKGVEKKKFQLESYNKSLSQRESVEKRKLELSSKLTENEEKLKTLDKAFAKYEKNLDKLKKELEKNQTAYDEKQQALEHLKGLALAYDMQDKEFKKYEDLAFKCPHCNKDIFGTHIIRSLRSVSTQEFTIDELKKNIAQAEDEKAVAYSKLTNTGQDFTRENQSGTAIALETREGRKQITEIISEQKNNEELLKSFSVKPDYDEASLLVLEQKEKEKLTKLIEQKEKEQKLLDKIKSELWGYKTTLNTITIEGKELSKSIEEIDGKIKQIPNVDKFIEELENKKKKNIELKEKLEVVKGNYYAYTIIKQGVQPSSQARVNAIARLLPHISEGISKLMSNLLQENIDIKFDFSDKKLDIICNTYNLRTLSTGQRRCFDIAIATTIQEIAQKTSKNNIGFFIADELFDGLDQNRIYLVMSLLQNLKIPEMFIISHRQEAQELLKTLPNISNIIVKRNGNTSIAEVN